MFPTRFINPTGYGYGREDSIGASSDSSVPPVAREPRRRLVRWGGFLSLSRMHANHQPFDYRCSARCHAAEGGRTINTDVGPASLSGNAAYARSHFSMTLGPISSGPTCQSVALVACRDCPLRSGAVFGCYSGFSRTFPDKIISHAWSTKWSLFAKIF